MPLKGIVGLYEYCCDSVFYEWHFLEATSSTSKNIYPGSICWAPVYYIDCRILTLAEEIYNPIEERDSTWKIVDFDEGTRDRRLRNRPYKEFQLEKDDDLLLFKCKIRPVLAIKEFKCDWRVPRTYFDNQWLCLPIYSYRQRHIQVDVIADQRLRVPSRFYFPPGIPGIGNEGAALLNRLQCIPEDNLEPYKCFCDLGETPMDQHIKLSNKAFQAIVGHLLILFPGIDITGTSKEWYDFFKELVNEEIDRLRL
jgi:hypothetical protein